MGLLKKKKNLKFPINSFGTKRIIIEACSSLYQSFKFALFYWRPTVYPDPAVQTHYSLMNGKMWLIRSVTYYKKIHPHAGQRFHKKGPYVGGSVSDFTWCCVLITSGWRTLCHRPPPFSPTPPCVELIGRGEAAGTETALSWWPVLCAPQPAIKPCGRTQACQMGCQMRFGVTSGFDV